MWQAIAWGIRVVSQMRPTVCHSSHNSVSLPVRFAAPFVGTVMCMTQLISQQNVLRGMFIGFIGIALFSFTLPFTRYTIQFADPLLVAWGRGVVAGLAACVCLLATRQRKPNALELKYLCLAIVGIVFGWPTLSSISMKYAPAAHGAVINGLLPISTAVIGAFLARQRLSSAFWALALIGAALVAVYALWEGGGALQAGDGVMLIAVLFGGLGYAGGAKAATTLGGWQTICWALVIALPLTSAASLWAYRSTPIAWAAIPALAWWAFAYLALVSQLIGFFAWYAGLALGGVPAVSQVQLLQIFMTVAASSALALDPVPARTWVFAVLVIGVLVAVRAVGSSGQRR
jgi:drug/metabolite transporter (DMT)-like permease